MTTRTLHLPGGVDLNSNLNAADTLFVNIITKKVTVGYYPNPAVFDLQVDGTVQADQLFKNNVEITPDSFVKSGFIALWSGKIEDIPPGWTWFHSASGKYLAVKGNSTLTDTNGGSNSSAYNNNMIAAHDHGRPNSSGHNHYHNRSLGGHPHSHPVHPAIDVFGYSDRITYHWANGGLGLAYNKRGGETNWTGGHNHNFWTNGHNHGHSVSCTPSGGGSHPADNAGTYQKQPRAMALHLIKKD